MDNRILATVEPPISSPNLAQGNLMMQNQAKFRVLQKKPRMSQLCEKKALFLFLVTAGNRYKVRRDDEDGWVQITLLCREYVFLESFRKPNRWELFQQAQLSDRSLRFI